MLKRIPDLLDAEFLWVLRSMGHGNELVICDRNFPATSVALHTVSKRLVRVTCTTTELGRALFKLLPVDTFIETPIRHMQVVGEPERRLDVHEEFKAAADAGEARDVPMGSMERYAFYEAARRAYAVVQTTEARPYGCFIVTKGVVFD